MIKNQFSYYGGGITQTIPTKTITIEDFFAEIKSDRLRSHCENIRNITHDNRDTLKKERNILKKQLPYATVAGVFSKRDAKSNISMSGYAAIDIDGISTTEQLQTLKSQLAADKYVVGLFVSPSGFGLKIIISIECDITKYPDLILAFYYYLSEKYKIATETLDSKTRDISRACYLSHDANAILKLEYESFNEEHINSYLTKKTDKKDTSRSAEEYNQVLKMLYSGKSKDEIYVYMNRFSKWAESPAQYRDYTYEKAKNYVETKAPTGEAKNIFINSLFNFLMENHFIHTTREENRSEMYIYQDGIYVNNGRAYIKEILSKKICKLYTKNLAEKIIEKIEAETYISPEDLFKEEDPKFICVKNGILNLFTKELTDFDPKYRFFNKLPIEYDKTAQATNTIQHYNTVLYPQDVNLMQELYGYLLYRDYKFEKAFIFSGDGGNGKGKSVEQIKNFVGIDNVSAIDLQTLESNGFMVASLHKKLANLAADIGRTKIDETRNFKQVTGHDTIEANRKHLSSVKFTNYAKMIFNANEIPVIDDKSEGFWRRWVIIRFDVAFKGDTEYNKLVAEGKLLPKHRKADTGIIQKLSQPTELSGVLNWALEGFERLINQGDFSYTKSEEETKKAMKKYGSTVMRFFCDECVKVSDKTIYEEHDNLFDNYIAYCHRKNFVPENSVVFKKQLSEEAPCNRIKTPMGYEYRWIYIKHIGGKQ
jgi:P4 family phage/plasmid primase-like protien